MQAVSSDEIVLTFSHEFNVETYRVSFEFQVIIRYVYALAPLSFSNSKQETSSHFPASCHLLHSLIKQIYRFSVFFSQIWRFNYLLSLFVCLFRFHLLFFSLALSLSPWHPNIASGSISTWEHSRAVWLICSEGRETELMNLLLDFWNSRLPRLDRLTDCPSRYVEWGCVRDVFWVKAVGEKDRRPINYINKSWSWFGRFIFCFLSRPYRRLDNHLPRDESEES